MVDEKGGIEDTDEEGHKHEEPEERKITLDGFVIVALMDYQSKITYRYLPQLPVERSDPLEEHVNPQLDQSPCAFLLS